MGDKALYIFRITFKNIIKHIILYKHLKSGIFLFISILAGVHLCSAQNFTEHSQEMTAHASQLDNIDTANLELLPLYDCLLMDAENKLGGWYRNYDQASADYQVQYMSIKYRIVSLRSILSLQIQKADTLFFQKSLSASPERQRYYLRRCIEVNPCFLDAYYHLMLLDLDSMNINAITQQFAKILEVFYLSENTLSQFEQLAQRIYDKGMEQGIKYNSQKQYNEALAIYSQLETFCKTIPLCRCDYNLIHEAILQSKKGVYTAYLNVARKALDGNKVVIANAFMLKALNYQSENSTWLNDKSDALVLANKITNVYIEQGRYYYFSNKDREAESSFAQAQQLSLLQDEDYQKEVNVRIENIKSQTYSTLAYNAPEAVLLQEKTNSQKKPKSSRKVKTSLQESSQIALNEGLTLLSSGEFDAAIAVFEKQKNKTKQDSIKQEMDACIWYANKLKLLAQFDKMEFQLWSESSVNPEQLLNSIFAQAKMQDLEQDSDFLLAVKNFRQKLADKNCKDIQTDIEYQFAEIDRKCLQNDYQSATFILHNIEKSIESSSCKFSHAQLGLYQARLRYPVLYYTMLQDAENALEMNDTLKYIHAYLNAEQFYLNKQLDTMHIVHTYLYERVKFYYTDKLFETILENYITIEAYEQALNTLDIMFQNGYPVRNTTAQQRLIGLHLAKNHKNQGKYASIPSYYLCTKWFNPFKKAYYQ